MLNRPKITMKTQITPKANIVEKQKTRGFREWLLANTKLSHRSARDVVSRYLRIKKIFDPEIPKTDEEFVFQWRNSKEYQDCTTTVRSQIKRAGLLYRQYKKETNAK